MSWLDDIVTVLESGEVGTFGVDIFTSTQAAIPRLESGSILTIVETGGSAPDYVHNLPGPAQRLPTAQLLARASDYPTAHDKVNEAVDVLSKVTNQVINAKFYQSIRLLGDIIDLKPDERGNARAGFNILGRKRP